MLPTPRQLAARFERGEIDRAEFQSQMAIHARELISEMEEEHLNPLSAWMEMRLAKSTVKRLLKQHSAYRIREILSALSEAPGFPLARYLWNAPHPDVPLHCFFRIRREPVFRILSIRDHDAETEIEVEILRSRNRTKITLHRDAYWRLQAPSFSKAAGPA